MSVYYKPNRNPDWNYGGPNWKLSRSKIDLFLECARCFYVDNKLGVARPPGFPFSLNSAVDKLLKKEFDIHRVGQTTHPLMKEYGIDAVPFAHPKMEKWRDSMKHGIDFLHTPTNLFVKGGVDDVWVAPSSELMIVDYKATSKDGEVNLDAKWQDGYKKQMEVYQWLFRKNGFKVSSVGYFVYVNGKTDRKAFDGKLEFDVKIIPYKGDDSWVEKTLGEIKACLLSEVLPEASKLCDYCNYRQAAGEATRGVFKENTLPKTESAPVEKKKKKEVDSVNDTLF